VIPEKTSTGPELYGCQGTTCANPSHLTLLSEEGCCYSPLTQFVDEETEAHLRSLAGVEAETTASRCFPTMPAILPFSGSLPLSTLAIPSTPNPPQTMLISRTF
jgi:hypothetical protein